MLATGRRRNVLAELRGPAGLLGPPRDAGRRVPPARGSGSFSARSHARPRGGAHRRLRPRRGGRHDLRRPGQSPPPFPMLPLLPVLAILAALTRFRPARPRLSRAGRNPAAAHKRQRHEHRIGHKAQREPPATAGRPRSGPLRTRRTHKTSASPGTCRGRPCARKPTPPIPRGADGRQTGPPRWHSATPSRSSASKR